MRRRRDLLFASFLVGVFAFSPVAVASGTDWIPRMTKEELRGLLESPEVVILDVRRQGGNAPEKISGAVFEDPEKVSSWASKYSKDKKIVLYCS